MCGQRDISLWPLGIPDSQLRPASHRELWMRRLAEMGFPPAYFIAADLPRVNDWGELGY